MVYTSLVCKDIGIIIYEFVAKTLIVFTCFPAVESTNLKMISFPNYKHYYLIHKPYLDKTKLLRVS